jgi:hypothetical protein
MTRPLVIAAALLAAACAGTTPAADSPRPGSLSLSVGGSVGTAAGVVSQSR